MIHEELSARTQMLIRKTTEEVFDAFVEPKATTMFWFIKSSGKLEPGRIFRWDWEMHGVSVQILSRSDKNLCIYQCLR